MSRFAGGTAAASFRPRRRRLVYFGRENTGSLDRHVFFRKDRIGDSALVEFLTTEPAICPTP